MVSKLYKRKIPEENLSLLRLLLWFLKEAKALTIFLGETLFKTNHFEWNLPIVQHWANGRMKSLVDEMSVSTIGNIAAYFLFQFRIGSKSLHIC